MRRTGSTPIKTRPPSTSLIARRDDSASENAAKLCLAACKNTRPAGVSKRVRPRRWKKNAVVLFKASEGLAERRMGKANRFRSEGEASVLGKRDDLFELRQAEHGPSPEVHAYRSGMLFSLPS